MHFWLVVGVCLPLRLDARLAYVAANVSLPFIAPFLGLAEVQLGALVRSGHTLAIDAQTARAHGLDAFAWDLAVGTALLAPGLGAVGFGLTLLISMLWPRKTPLGAAIGRASRRYPTHGARVHARAKLASDPVARALTRLGSLGDVVDVGCGAGHMALLLLENGQAASVRGFDPDRARIALAREAARGLSAQFEVGDARAQTIPPCDTVLLVDVLHYVDADAQRAILERAAQTARTRVVVRDIDPTRGVRSAFTRAAELLRNAPHTRRTTDLAGILAHAGLEVRVMRCDEGTPFANALLVATRARPDEGEGRCVSPA